MAPPKNPRKPPKGKEAKETSRKGKEKKNQPKKRKSSKQRERERQARRERAQRQRGIQTILDYAHFHNGRELELPEEQDFAGYSAVPRKGYYLKLRQLREEAKKEDDDPPQPESLTAPAPWVPSPYGDESSSKPYWAGDDYEQEDEQEESRGRPKKRVCTRPNVPAKRQRYYSKYSHLSQEFILPEDESEVEELPEHIIRKTPPTFMGIPTEIRLQIYRHILTVQKPIKVFGGWTQVYWTKDLQLSTSILRACRAVYEEACTVLYGANTFLYRLRDASARARDIDNLATDDSSRVVDDDSEHDDDDDDDDSDLDYEEEGDEESPAVREKECSINIARYAHLFRKISIMAEANRHSGYTQEGMAAAINVFARKAAQDGTGWQAASYNIHTLTVCIMPTCPRQGGEDKERQFTFVGFFLPGSPVLRAIQAVDCQTLKVDILTRQSKRDKTCSMSGTGSCRLVFNRMYQRICDNRARIDPGDRADRMMRWRDARLARQSERRIDGLATHIAMFCKQRGFARRTTEGMDVDSPYWDGFEMEEDEEGDGF
ncbi:hypothetical protein J3F83DRAFT_769671 [Trichoderma novae-zelandiae]